MDAALDWEAPPPGRDALAALVVLSALVLTLEIMQHLLAARAAAALAMAAAWLCLLSPAAQVRAVVYAAVSHGASEGAAQWRASFPAVFARNRDRLVVLWLLFWVRVFVWGATLGALAGFDRRASLYHARNGALDADDGSWASAAAIALYYELVEVLLLLYLSAEPLPYRLDHRAVNWAAVLALSCFERSTGWMLWVMDSPVFSWMSPRGVLCVLVVVMAATMQIPWDEIARRVEAPYLNVHKTAGARGRHSRDTDAKTRIAYVFRYAHEEGSSEDTALDTASDDEYEGR